MLFFLLDIFYSLLSFPPYEANPKAYQRTYAWVCPGHNNYFKCSALWKTGILFLSSSLIDLHLQLMLVALEVICFSHYQEAFCLLDDRIVYSKFFSYIEVSADQIIT